MEVIKDSRTKIAALIYSANTSNIKTVFSLPIALMNILN